MVLPKTRGSILIYIDDFVTETLREHKSWQNEFIMKNRKFYSDYDFAFINTNKYPGYPMHPHYIYDHMKKILKKMEHSNKLAPHSLRHTHASLCIEAGIALRDIAERLGHNDH
ncbi:tyrosine-type recombinase/integrase [Gracilibacillus caseinilyticus]|uniref:Tyrosine-type recombinase/integrase n=2 Tax=Gracilibacillus caseinilyticus TaxID=2932256 RepID=A0ABY4EZ65_9BACI|nr:tyrosine-type recombinase/integrase [Gracilibacillus caseinilyticus]UOQ49158.1 tyrosine-type recombinase/integrase [Gracilibacillus caseinilyticus]